MRITSNPGTLGAKVEGLDLSKPLDQAAFSGVLRALGEHSVLCFPRQHLDALSLKAFSERFGSLQGSPTSTYCEPGVPEVMLLSNIVEDGKAGGPLPPEVIEMKKRFDPMGLLNPGKLRDWPVKGASATA